MQSIEPKVLAELSQRALWEEQRLQNPYLRALMARFRLVALELKAALESEGRLDGGQTDAADNDQSHE
jgi:hypothetical protein